MKLLNKKHGLVLLLLAAALVAAGYVAFHVSQTSDSRNSDAAQTLGDGDTATYTSLSGESVSLRDYEGSVRVVNSWASWSPYSKTELPQLNELAQKYADEGVVVIAINRNEDPVRAERFIERLGALDQLVVLIDPEDSFYERVGGHSMPETVFFDRKGNIVAHIRGELTVEQMSVHVDTALAAQ